MKRNRFSFFLWCFKQTISRGFLLYYTMQPYVYIYKAESKRYKAPKQLLINLHCIIHSCKSGSQFLSLQEARSDEQTKKKRRNYTSIQILNISPQGFFHNNEIKMYIISQVYILENRFLDMEQVSEFVYQHCTLISGERKRKG